MKLTLLLPILLFVICDALRAAETTDAAKPKTKKELTMELEKKVIPKVQFKEASLAEIVVWMQKNQIPVEVTQKFERRTIDTKITITLNNVPAMEVLKYITNLSATKYQVQDGKVILLGKDE